MHKKERPKEFDLFLTFLKGEPAIQDALLWVFSIGTKIDAIELFYEETLGLIPKCCAELSEIEIKGYCIFEECTKLTIKYEAFLNSIYALCENLSRIVSYLYRSKNLPQNFADQKSRFLEDSNIDSDYSKIIMNTNWYDEVSSIRSEATHYLSGLVDSFDFEELIYDNVPKGERKGAQKDISIKNIEKHIRRIHDNVWTFLSLFGNHFIKIINQDTRVSFTCSLPTTPPEPIGSKIISFREYLNGESGICQTPSLECPMKDSCDAYKKSKSGNMK